MKWIEVEGEKNKSKNIVGNSNTILGTYYAQGALLGIGYAVVKKKKTALALSPLGKINVNELEKYVTCRHDKCYKGNLKNTKSLTSLVQNSVF